MTQGGLIQLAAHGVQDAVLTGQPQLTFFKQTYKRHTAFAIETNEMVMNGTLSFGSKMTVPILRMGDLVTRVWFEFTVPRVASTQGYEYQWARDLGFALLRAAELEIGGQRIERLTGEWMTIQKELTTPESKMYAMNSLVGNLADAPGPGEESVRLCVPIPFTFARNPGLSLPLIALQHHQVDLRLELAELDTVLSHWSPGGAFEGRGLAPGDSLVDRLDATVFVDYVLLDTDERNRFADAEHEYLVEQIQTKLPEVWDSSPQYVPLDLNHPVKAIYWVFRDDAASVQRGNPFVFESALRRAKIQLNHIDRTPSRHAVFYRLVQPMENHTRVSGHPIYMYSFALRAEDYQPTGTCNFSRIDRAILAIEDAVAPPTKGRIFVYAVNYNVLRVSSGMANLTFAN